MENAFECNAQRRKNSDKVTMQRQSRLPINCATNLGVCTRNAAAASGIAQDIPEGMHVLETTESG